MIKELLLHPSVKRQLDDFTARPSHALMLIGPEGSGKRTLALTLAAKLLGLPESETVLTHPYTLLLVPTENSLSIAAIRHLNERLALKTLGTGSIRRIIIVESAHTLTIEAQNAFLKILEEPPADTVIIMTVVGQRSMLPTVYSRTQQIIIRQLDKEVLLRSFTERGFKQTDAEKAFYVSDGRIGLMHALLQQDKNHPLIEAIDTAKQLLKLPGFGRLSYVDKISKDKEQINILLEALQRVAHAALVRASERQSDRVIRHWRNTLESIHVTRSMWQKNANPKLLLTDLLLNL